MLLNKEPQDYDIATSARPEDIQRMFPETLPVGAQFGVILVLVDGQPFEVASFRHDGPYLDGRRPSQVRYGSLEEDIQRRDFTINGMVYDPIADRVIDLVEGRKDLERRRIRAIGDRRARFEEDRLRMIRAVRFAASLKFAIERATFAAIQRLAPTITEISWERIGDEMTRILTEGGARRGFELLDESGLLKVLLPEIVAMKGTTGRARTIIRRATSSRTRCCCLAIWRRRPKLWRTVVCCTMSPSRFVYGRRATAITFYGHTDQGAEMAEDILKRLKRGPRGLGAGQLSGAQSLAPGASAADALEHAQAFLARGGHRGIVGAGAHRRVVVQRRFESLSILQGAPGSSLKRRRFVRSRWCAAAI